MDQPQKVQSRFDRKTIPQEYLAQCSEAWQHVPQEVWVHRFVHTLEPIAKNWYAKAQLRRDTISWDCLVDSFVLTFSTNEVCPALDAAIRLVHTKVLDAQEIVKYRPDWMTQEAHAVEYYNLAIDEDDDPRNIGIPESEEHCDVHGPAAESLEVTQPLKTRTVNIGSEDQPKYVTSGDYWDGDTSSIATQLLHECRALCLRQFLEIRGIIEAMDGILSWVEARLHVADGV